MLFRLAVVAGFGKNKRGVNRGVNQRTFQVKRRTKETRDLDTELLGVYRRLLGALLFCSVVSRPDIAYAVGMLSRVMSCPTREALFAAGRVLTYLVQTKEYGLTFSRSHAFTLGRPQALTL